MIPAGGLATAADLTDQVSYRKPGLEITNSDEFGAETQSQHNYEKRRLFGADAEL